jgi:hypothetical protein
MTIGSPEEIFEHVARRTLESDDAMPLVEFMTFSGAAADVRTAEGHVLLKLTGQHADDAGEAYEVWARLVAPAGAWRIPRVPTEMLVVCPPRLWRRPGSAWAIHGAQLPPGKVSQDVAYWPLDDETTLLQRLGGWAMKTAAGTVIGIDKTSGDVQITHASGTRFVVAENLIELMVTKAGDPSEVATVLRLDQGGMRLGSNGKIAAHWDGESGAFTQVGADGCYLAHPGGVLGPAGAVPIGTPGGGASLNWKMGG